jgi:prevent-host-death family protein
MTKHWTLQDAKPRLSELVRAAEKEAQLTLVTRNVRGFRFPGRAAFNPWSK